MTDIDQSFESHVRSARSARKRRRDDDTTTKRKRKPSFTYNDHRRLAVHTTMTSATSTIIGKTTARALAAVAVGGGGSFLWVHHHHHHHINNNLNRVDDRDKREDDDGATIMSTRLSSSLQSRMPLSSQAKFSTLLSFSNLTTKHSACETSVDPSFPDLSRFGSHSYLKRYLTPEVYAQLKDKTTSNGVTLEDLIQSGVTLPWGARPPRGTGVYAGDAESYDVFADILVGFCFFDLVSVYSVVFLGGDVSPCNGRYGATSHAWHGGQMKWHIFPPEQNSIHSLHHDSPLYFDSTGSCIGRLSSFSTGTTQRGRPDGWKVSR